MDKRCNRARGQNTVGGCFHLQFAERKKQSASGMLGYLPKQMVGGMGRVSGISQAFPEQKKAIGGCDRNSECVALCL